jgi:hypothetical protein
MKQVARIALAVVAIPALACPSIEFLAQPEANLTAPSATRNPGQIVALVTASGTGLTGLFGVSPVIAGRVLAAANDVTRFATGSRMQGTGRSTTPCANTARIDGFIALAWKDGRLVGIEVLDAGTPLHHDLLYQAGTSS